MFRTRSSIALLAVMVLLVTACSGGATTAPSTGGAAPSTAPVGSTAVEPSAATGGGGSLLIWADAKRAEALKPLAAQFGTEQGVTVKIEAIAKDLVDQFKTASKAGTGPDMIITAHDHIGDLVANGLIDPITLTNAADFDPIAIKGMTLDGQLYGVPYNVENIALFRNTDLVPDAPKSMEDLIAAGQKLVTDGKAEKIMALQVGQQGDPYHIFPLFVSGGGGLFGTTAGGDPDPSQVLVDSDGSIAAGEKIQALGEKGDKALTTAIDGGNSIPLFFNKKAPFLVSGPWAVADIKKAGIKYDISAIPPFAGGKPAGPFIGVNGFLIATNGKNKAIAQEFATNFATTKDVQIAFYNAEPRPPALIAAYDEVKATDPDVDKFASAREGGQILPAIPAMGKVWTPLGVAEAAIVKGADVAATLKTAAKAIRDGIAGG